MTERVRWFLIGAVFWTLGGPHLGSARADDVQVNTYTTNLQQAPAVAADPGGDLVVVWRSGGSSGTDTSLTSIQGQRYASDGSPQGGEFQINTYTMNNQFNPAVAVDADGDFVVVWDSSGSSDTDTSASSIQGQRYASDGSPAGGEFQVNTYTTGSQRRPAVAMDAAGNFVVVWGSRSGGGTDPSYSIQGQRYASDGSPVSSQFQVNTYTTNLQRYPSAAMTPGGDFVVVWGNAQIPLPEASGGADPSGDSIRGQRYAADGSQVGGDFQINTYTTDDQDKPTGAMDAAGNFVLVWHSQGSGGTDTSQRSIQGRRFAADGSPAGGDFQVNTSTMSTQSYPVVAMAVGGAFVVAWDSVDSAGTDTSSFSVQSQRYAADGTPVASELQVNCYTTNIQGRPSVAMDADGEVVVVWYSGGSSGTAPLSSIQRTPASPTVDPHLIAIPTLTGWGLWLLVGLLALVAVRRLRGDQAVR